MAEFKQINLFRWRRNLLTERKRKFFSRKPRNNKGILFPLVLLSAADCVFVFLWQIPPYSTILFPLPFPHYTKIRLSFFLAEGRVSFVARQTWHSLRTTPQSGDCDWLSQGGFGKVPPLAIVHSE
ncbi:hypothetical protein CDAR_15971 [Caerostris darwini]|uniref:Transmembrane protein n=1 Tax=Caerostris darwini TaxID=1538125 RepID=A0AAV4SP07_9ARAC|nr:hypothetical protein CDAR_15971 [Caerostris darwini]